MTIESNDATPSALPVSRAVREGARGAAALQAAGHREDVNERHPAPGGHSRQPAAGRRGGPRRPPVEPGRRRAARRRRTGRDDAAGGGRARRHHRRRGAPRLLGADVLGSSTRSPRGRGRRRIAGRVGDRLGALNWRGGGEGVFGAPDSGGRPPGYPAVVRRDRHREADRGHDRRVLVPRPLRAGQDQVHAARAELPPPLLVTRPLGRRLRLVRGVPHRGPRLPPVGGRPAGRTWAATTSSSTRRTTARCATRTPAPRMVAAGRDPDAELAFDAALDSSLFDGVTGVTTALHVCRGNGPAGRVALGGRLRRHLGRHVPEAGHGSAAAGVRLRPAGEFEPLRDVRESTWSCSGC